MFWNIFWLKANGKSRKYLHEVERFEIRNYQNINSTRKTENLLNLSEYGKINCIQTFEDRKLSWKILYSCHCLILLLIKMNGFGLLMFQYSEIQVPCYKIIKQGIKAGLIMIMMYWNKNCPHESRLTFLTIGVMRAIWLFKLSCLGLFQIDQSRELCIHMFSKILWKV